MGPPNLNTKTVVNCIHKPYTIKNLLFCTDLNGKSGIEYHDAIEFSVFKKKPSSDDPSQQQQLCREQLTKVCTDVLGKQGKGRRVARRLLEAIQISTHDHLILDGTRKSILDQSYINLAAKIIIQELVPEVGDISEISFHTDKKEDGIIVATNINFDALNVLYHKRISPEHSAVTPANILSHILNAEKELFFSSSNLSELASSVLSAKLAKAKIDYILDRSVKSRERLNRFEGFIFGNAKAIREAVNSQQVDLDELIVVLQKSRQFKKWIVGQKPDTDLVKNYHEEVTRGSFIDKLPGKTARWALFTGLGFAVDAYGAGGIGTATGIALGALDTFFVDKLISGWKPNQFIENDVKKLIHSKH